MSSWPHGYCLRRATRVHLNVGISGGGLALVHNIYPMFKIRPGKRFLLPHIIEFHSNLSHYLSLTRELFLFRKERTLNEAPLRNLIIVSAFAEG